jgi:hypothetical protein
VGWGGVRRQGPAPAAHRTRRGGSDAARTPPPPTSGRRRRQQQVQILLRAIERPAARVCGEIVPVSPVPALSARSHHQCACMHVPTPRDPICGWCGRPATPQAAPPHRRRQGASGGSSCPSPCSVYVLEKAAQGRGGSRSAATGNERRPRGGGVDTESVEMLDDQCVLSFALQDVLSLHGGTPRSAPHFDRARCVCVWWDERMPHKWVVPRPNRVGTKHHCPPLPSTHTPPRLQHTRVSRPGVCVAMPTACDAAVMWQRTHSGVCGLASLSGALHRAIARQLAVRAALVRTRRACVCGPSLLRGVHMLMLVYIETAAVLASHSRSRPRKACDPGDVSVGGVRIK